MSRLWHTAAVTLPRPVAAIKCSSTTCRRKDFFLAPGCRTSRQGGGSGRSLKQLVTRYSQSEGSIGCLSAQPAGFSSLSPLMQPRIPCLGNRDSFLHNCNLSNLPQTYPETRLPVSLDFASWESVKGTQPLSSDVNMSFFAKSITAATPVILKMNVPPPGSSVVLWPLPRDPPA